MEMEVIENKFVVFYSLEYMISNCIPYMVMSSHESMHEMLFRLHSHNLIGVMDALNISRTQMKILNGTIFCAPKEFCHQNRKRRKSPKMQSLI